MPGTAGEDELGGERPDPGKRPECVQGGVGILTAQRAGVQPAVEGGGRDGMQPMHLDVGQAGQRSPAEPAGARKGGQ
ncbi:hypothetical protein BH20ACT5_BH20ACT5_01830 [soil metagenome]